MHSSGARNEQVSGLTRRTQYTSQHCRSRSCQLIVAQGGQDLVVPLHRMHGAKDLQLAILGRFEQAVKVQGIAAGSTAWPAQRRLYCRRCSCSRFGHLSSARKESKLNTACSLDCAQPGCFFGVGVGVLKPLASAI